jgi:hypothetical protein
MRQCRICKREEFKEVIDFGKQPLVNSLIEEEDLDKEEPTFGLLVERCENCGLVQIVDPIDTETIYRNVDYLYFSGEMPGLIHYFQEYVNELEELGLEQNDLIVEIGSNDGLMLGLFDEKYRKLGVDPASNTVVRALAAGVPTLSDGFGGRIAKSIKRDFGEAKLIYGNNCIAHIDDLHGVMKGVDTLLEDDGVFVVECNYWGGMVDNLNYSLIYHDHFSYFTVHDWFNIGGMYGLYPFDAHVTPAQGGSLRIFLSKGPRDMTPRLKELFEKEVDSGLLTSQTCDRYREDVLQKATALGNDVRKLKSEGKIIAGCGAAAKGFSILALAGLTDEEIDFFIDDSPAKQGKYTPVDHIPVVKRDERPDPDVFIITAPNYADIIKSKESSFDGEWIVP